MFINNDLLHIRRVCCQLSMSPDFFPFYTDLFTFSINKLKKKLAFYFSISLDTNGNFHYYYSCYVSSLLNNNEYCFVDTADACAATHVQNSVSFISFVFWTPFCVFLV